MSIGARYLLVWTIKLQIQMKIFVTTCPIKRTFSTHFVRPYTEDIITLFTCYMNDTYYNQHKPSLSQDNKVNVFHHYTIKPKTKKGEKISK